MNRSKIILAVGLLAVLASVVLWLASRLRRPVEFGKPVVRDVTLLSAKAIDTAAESFHALVTARAGQITGAEIAKQRQLLVNRSPASRATLEGMLRSADPFERLLAFRLLMESDGWSRQLSERALQDSFVLLRVEAADWLYLAGHFQEWDVFLSASAGNAATDYAALKLAIQHGNWNGLPAGLEMLGVGRGIDRYFREILRRSDTAGSLVEKDLLSAEIPAVEKQALLRLMHAANRSDYEMLLRKMLVQSNEDTPVRYEAAWLLGQAFASPATREFLSQHLAENANDPLRSRVEQALTSINEQQALGRDRLTMLEARLAAASKSGSRAEFGSALVGLIDEALRSSRVFDKALLQEAKRALPDPGIDYIARQRSADIDFLIFRSK